MQGRRQKAQSQKFLAMPPILTSERKALVGTPRQVRNVTAQGTEPGVTARPATTRMQPRACVNAKHDVPPEPGGYGSEHILSRRM